MSETAQPPSQEAIDDGSHMPSDAVARPDPDQLESYFHDLLTLGPKEVQVRRFMGEQGSKLVQREVMPVAVGERTNDSPDELALVGVTYPDQVGGGKESFDPTDLIRLGMHGATTHEELGRFIPLIENPLLPNYIQKAIRSNAHRGYHGGMVAGSGLNNAETERRAVAMALTQLRMALSLKAVTIAEEHIAVEGDESVDGFVSWLETVKPTMPLVGKVESRCREILRDQGPDRAPGIFTILRGIEDRGISDTETDKHVVLAAPTLLAVHPEVAEMLQSRLTKEMATARDEGQEQAYRHIARELIHKLLERYRSDPTRHTENIQKILGFIFPEATRPDTMSRVRLVALANHACLSLDNTPDKYDWSETGLIGPAFGDVLRTTQSQSQPEQARQALEDQLYANVIGMLLEQRKV